ncbi:MAG: hypothetical protein ACREH9_10495, partial [Pseudomonadota bacterium]
MSNESAKVGGEPHDVVIVGGGSAGIATAASLLKRRPDIQVRNNAREVSCYLSIEEATRFKGAAAASKVSLSRYLRQCLLDYERLIEDSNRAPIK